MELYGRTDSAVLEKWAYSFPPAGVTLCRLETGERVFETSLVAAGMEQCPERALRLKRRFRAAYLAAGKAALAYENTSDAVVFSPLRWGQVADYDAAVYLFKSFLRLLHPGLRLPRPAVCIRMQEQTTQVERIALIDAGIQAGAGDVFLYRSSLSELREFASQKKELRHSFAIHIETREK